MTALNSSAFNGLDKCLDLLIKAGARLDLEDNWGDTALSNATDKNHPECVALLEAAHARAETTIELARAASLSLPP